MRRGYKGGEGSKFISVRARQFGGKVMPPIEVPKLHARVDPIVWASCDEPWLVWRMFMFERLLQCAKSAVYYIDKFQKEGLEIDRVAAQAYWNMAFDAESEEGQKLRFGLKEAFLTGLHQIGTVH